MWEFFGDSLLKSVDIFVGGEISESGKFYTGL
jgi:hypothetical protein